MLGLAPKVRHPDRLPFETERGNACRKWRVRQGRIWRFTFPGIDDALSQACGEV